MSLKKDLDEVYQVFDGEKPIESKCPKCEKRILVLVRYFGREAMCPKCNERIYLKHTTETILRQNIAYSRTTARIMTFFLVLAVIQLLAIALYWLSSLPVRYPN